MNLRKLSQIILISFILHSIFKTNAIGQVIPNSGFENWTTDIWTNQNFDFWKSTNADFQPAKIDTAKGYAGNWALVAFNWAGATIYNIAVAECKFPISNHPTNLYGYVKTQYNSSDSVFIEAEYLNNGVVVDSGKWINYFGNPINNWTLINIPISQTQTIVDSAVIRISGGTQAGTKLFVDELSFTSPSGIENLTDTKRFEIYPSAFSENTLIKSKLDLIDISISILDNTGKIVKQIENIKGKEYVLTRENLMPGLYHVIFTLNSKILKSEKIVITDY